MDFPKYKLNDSEIKGIANLCLQEQGNLEGAKAEASLAANILETNSYYKRKFGTDIYSFMRNSGWFSRAAYYMDHGNASQTYCNAIKDILCNGNRTLPIFVDEHDCFGDIKTATNNGKLINKTRRNEYQQDITLITNVYGSVYYFWCFPTSTSDPFGYTNIELRNKYKNDPESNKKYVEELYEELLGRKADTAGLTMWVEKLNSGTMTREQVRNAIMNSKEYQEKQKNIYTENIKTFQKWLNKYLQTNIAVDGECGSDTKRKAVMAMQTYLNKTYNTNLVVDGSFGNASQKAYKTVKSGSKGDNVYIVQGLLYGHKIDPNGFDGVCGNGCVKAIKTYQSQKELTVDGKCGSATFASLTK